MNKTKKIIYCVRSMDMAGGKERAVAKIANILADEYEVCIVSLANAHTSFYSLNPQIRLISLNCLSFLGKPKRLKTLRLFFQAVKTLALFMRSERAPIIIGTDFLVNILLVIARCFARSKSLIIGWEHLPLEEPIISSKKVLISIRNFFYKRLYVLIVLTHTDFAYSQAHGIKAKIIPNPRSFDFDGTVDYHKKNVLTIARLSYQKGLDLYLRVIAAIKNQIKGWQFVLVAKEDDIKLSDFLADMEKHQLGAYIKLYPPTEEIIDIYKNASIYLLTSRYEGLPITLIEAQTCGIPCISFDCKTGPAEIISNGDDGFIVPPFDIDQMARRLLDLINDVKLREQMGEKAKLASYRFDEKHIIDLWQEVIKNER